MTATTESSALSHFSFPRTGKRGVPQQFPRRLYEMLDSETRSVEMSADYPKVITWSDSGKAFRIFDVAEFATSILPKYFRTKKFSSFQRNLNLYGFAKVRRGVDTDMYAHPSFVRDQPESLLDLRKVTTTSRRRLTSDTSERAEATRSVSPSLSNSVPNSNNSSPVIIESKVVINHGFGNRTQGSGTRRQPPSLPSQQYVARPIHKAMTQSRPQASPQPKNDRGKLDLLALALEYECARAS